MQSSILCSLKLPYQSISDNEYLIKVKETVMHDFDIGESISWCRRRYKDRVAVEWVDRKNPTEGTVSIDLKLNFFRQNDYEDFKVRQKIMR